MKRNLFLCVFTQKLTVNVSFWESSLLRKPSTLCLCSGIGDKSAEKSHWNRSEPPFVISLTTVPLRLSPPPPYRRRLHHGAQFTPVRHAVSRRWLVTAASANLITPISSGANRRDVSARNAHQTWPPLVTTRRHYTTAEMTSGEPGLWCKAEVSVLRNIKLSDFQLGCSRGCYRFEAK